jgi:hypothetical protein
MSERDLPPIACSLDAADQAARASAFRAIARRALLTRERGIDNIVLVYRRAPDVEAGLRELIRSEQECCPFFRFDMRAEGDRIQLDVGAPPEAAPLLDLLFEDGEPAP